MLSITQQTIGRNRTVIGSFLFSLFYHFYFFRLLCLLYCCIDVLCVWTILKMRSQGVYPLSLVSDIQYHQASSTRSVQHRLETCVCVFAHASLCCVCLFEARMPGIPPGRSARHQSTPAAERAVRHQVALTNRPSVLQPPGASRQWQHEQSATCHVSAAADCLRL